MIDVHVIYESEIQDALADPAFEALADGPAKDLLLSLSAGAYQEHRALLHVRYSATLGAEADAPSDPAARPGIPRDA